MNVAVYPFTRRGKQKWRVDYSENGKRKRPTFDSKAAAELLAADLRRGSSTAKSWWALLGQSQRDRIIKACYDAHDQEHDVVELLSRAKTLTPHSGPTLGDVLAELLKSKRNAGRSSDYIDALETMLNKFSSGRESVRIDALTVADVERFLDAGSLASRSTRRARLSTLFKFAVRRGYRVDNPCARVESVTYNKPPPQVFSRLEFKTAVRWLKENAPHGLAWFALSAVCGLRPEEAEKTTKGDINFTEGFIRVESQTTKIRQRRVVYPKAEAMLFLKRAIKSGTLPIDPQSRQRMIQGATWKTTRTGARKPAGTVYSRRPGLREALGWKTWPKDITRHTAASYWLASDGSAAHVSEMLGNSEGVLKRDYKALVTKKEAEAFWAEVNRLSTKQKCCE